MPIHDGECEKFSLADNTVKEQNYDENNEGAEILFF